MDISMDIHIHGKPAVYNNEIHTIKIESTTSRSQVRRPITVTLESRKKL